MSQAEHPPEPDLAEPPAAPPEAGSPIGTVERETRLGKDTLRVWERRYGFPCPQRDLLGERLYPAEQVRQLQHIKRLLDNGHRPGAVVGLPLAALQALGERRPAPRRAGGRLRPALDAAPPDAEVDALLAALRQHDVAGLRLRLGQALLRLGLEGFVCELAAPLAQAVGRAWAQGQLQVFEEHLCSEVLEGVLRQAIASAGTASSPEQTPRILLSTLPDEPHRLGLLMAEALFLVHGCLCVNLGPQTPLRDLVLAREAHAADIVALSLTLATPVRRAQADLRSLRRELPEAVDLWVGTQLPALHRHGVPGVHLLGDLGLIGPEVRRWRIAARHRPAKALITWPGDAG